MKHRIAWIPIWQKALHFTEFQNNVWMHLKQWTISIHSQAVFQEAILSLASPQLRQGWGWQHLHWHRRWIINLWKSSHVKRKVNDDEVVCYTSGHGRALADMLQGLSGYFEGTLLDKSKFTRYLLVYKESIFGTQSVQTDSKSSPSIVRDLNF